MNQQLLMALMQGAPAILSALKGAHMMPGDTANIENAVQNGADLGVMNDQFDEIAARRKSLTDGWDTPMSDTMNVYELNKLYDTEAQPFPSQSATADDLMTDLVNNADVSKISTAESQLLAQLNNPEVRAFMQGTPASALTDMQAEIVDGRIPLSDYTAPDGVPAGFNTDIPNQFGKRKTKYPAALSASSMLGALAQQRYKNDPAWAAKAGPQQYVK